MTDGTSAIDTLSEDKCRRSDTSAKLDSTVAITLGYVVAGDWSP
jgi:hypothetical protein